MESSNHGTNSVKTLQTAFEIIDILEESDGARVTEVADATGKAKSTIHRHLVTMEQEGYLVREGDEFHIGMRFLDLGDFARNRTEPYKIARKKVAELAEETNERSQFMVMEHGHAVYIERAFGSDAIRLNRGLGNRIPVHCSAAGKALLAEMNDDDIDQLIDSYGLQSKTQNTMSDRDELFEEIETIRERGYAINKEEHTEGITAIGAAVRLPSDQPIGSYSIAGPTHRIASNSHMDEIIDLLIGTAREVELQIAHS